MAYFVIVSKFKLANSIQGCELGQAPEIEIAKPEVFPCCLRASVRNNLQL